MIALNKQVFSRKLSQNDVRFTVNLRAADLKRLINPGGRFFSRDQNALPGEAATANVRQVWAALGEETPAEFVSIAVRSGADSSNVWTTLALYGGVVLEILPRIIAAEAVIFNGDVKTVGLKVAETGEPAWANKIAFNGDIKALAAELHQLIKNARSGVRPRLVGSYFEARLRRALVSGDVCAVWVDPSDVDALQAANDLCASNP